MLPTFLIVVLEKFVAKVIAALLSVPESTMSIACPNFKFCIVKVAVPTLPVNKNVVAADASKFWFPVEVLVAFAVYLPSNLACVTLSSVIDAVTTAF